jgi:hypothetical protein
MAIEQCGWFSSTRQEPAPGKAALRSASKLLPAWLLSCLLSGLLAAGAAAQDREQEVVANLAAGRVVLYFSRDGIVIGAIEQRVEAESRPPVVLPLGERRIGVLLGAVEWVLPASGRPPVRLDRELPRLVSQAARPQRKQDAEQASDIESIGVALLERLRDVTGQLHHKLDLGPEEPLVDLLLVDYEESYGAEAWLLRYRVAQENLRGDYWRTRVLRPSYTQLYPPEKGQPRTLVEVTYPPGDAGPAILDLFKRNDPRLARIRAADPQMTRAAERLDRGESQKAATEDASVFLRAALGAVAPVEAKLILGILHEQGGFHWLLAPPEQPQQADEGGKPREPDAPTLRKKPPQ